MLRGHEESVRRAGEGSAIASSFICSNREGLVTICMCLQGHPVAGRPGVLWVSPQEAERTGTRRKKLVQGIPLSQAAPEGMDSHAGSTFLTLEVTSSGWEVTWQGSPGELVSQ